MREEKCLPFAGYYYTDEDTKIVSIIKDLYEGRGHRTKLTVVLDYVLEIRTVVDFKIDTYI